MEQSLWMERFPFLSSLSDDERRYFLQTAVTHELRAGRVAVRDAADSTGVIFVLSGSLNVYKLSENGRELALYDVSPGEIVLLAFICAVGGKIDWAAHISVAALQDSVVGVLPCNTFGLLYANSPPMQQFVFSDLFDKFGEIISLTEKLMFQSVRDRLLAFIREQTQDGRQPLYITHAQAAARIGTSREVVTRHLRSMAAEKLVAVERGKITLLKTGRSLKRSPISKPDMRKGT